MQQFYQMFTGANFSRKPRATMAQSATRPGLTQIQTNAMTPSEILSYWLTGTGGKIYFSPSSEISKEFSQGDGAALLEALFYKKFNGKPNHLDKMNAVDYKYTWFFRAWNINSAVQIVGTWKGHAVRVNDNVLFRAENSMTVSSLTFGRQRSEIGWEWLNPTHLGPQKSDLLMTIEWSRPLKK